MSTSSADRNLLFGLLALQNNFLSRDDLLRGVNGWLRRKEGPLAEVLQEQGLLTEEDALLLDVLVVRHLTLHNDDALKSLAAVSTSAEVHAGLASLDDDALRSSVAALTTPVGLSTPAAAPTPPAPEPPGPGRSPRYRKLRPHARGGLGEVSVALDDELGREVALKEIQPQHADLEEYRARFLREAMITGQLEHPGIVPVYGLGTNADGRPCYAMRFIRGECLHDAIKRFHEQDQGPRGAGERELALRGLLTRFVAVCNAVAYAHSRGVIHRDLKPANVMLGEFGETLVVDWGLAKTVGQPEGGATAGAAHSPTSEGSTPTEMGRAVGTPAFMSPEQARGEHDRIDHRSDIFALGATLYYLLTGRPPYRGEVLAMLSDAVEARWAPACQVNPRVPRELEAVCGKAMAARPEDRYARAQHLGGDVERFLADEPVTARREPPGEKLRRWSKRNRALVSSGVVLLVAGVVGLGIGLGAVRAEEARTREALGVAEGQREEAEANLARAVRAEGEAKANLRQAEENLKLAKKAVDEAFGIARDHPLLEGPRLSDELHRLKRLMFEKALPFYRDFRARRPGDRVAQREVWEQLHRVGEIQNELGDKPDALKHFQEAVTVARALVKARPGEAEYKRDLARALHNVGTVQSELGQFREALACAAEAAGLLRPLVKAHPGALDYQKELTLALANQGKFQRALDQPEEALNSYREAIEQGRALLKARPGEAGFQASLAITLNNLGVLERNLGHPEEADKAYKESIALGRALLKARPPVPDHQNELARALVNLSLLQSARGQSKEALESRAEALELRRVLVKAQPGVATFQRDLAQTLKVVANRSRPEAALALYNEAAQVCRDLVQAQPAVLDYQQDLAGIFNNRGLLLQSALKKPEEALRSYREAIVLRRALVNARPDVPGYQASLALTLDNQGALLLEERRFEAALASFSEAVGWRRALLGSQPDSSRYQYDLAMLVLWQARALMRLHRPEEARRALDEALLALAALDRAHPNNPDVTRARFLAHHERGHALAASGKLREALHERDRAVALAPPRHRAGAQLSRAMLLARMGEHDRAAAEAESIAKRPGLTAETAFNAACALSLSAASACRDRRLPLPRAERLGDHRAELAMALLGRLARAGHYDDPANLAELDRSPALAYLRPRDDFKRLRASLEGKR